MATSIKQHEMRVNSLLIKPHFYWHRGFKQWTWNVSGRVFLAKNNIWLCNEFCRHLNLNSRPIQITCGEGVDTTPALWHTPFNS